MDKIKVVFIGTGEFAIPVLSELNSNEMFDLVGVVTQPDKPAGREQSLTSGPVKQFIEEVGMGVEVMQPTKISEDIDEIINKFNPELVIVASYGQIIPSKLLDYPKHGCLNFHGSLLPKLRGAVPIQSAILHGFKETGVTLQLMSERMDEGAVVSQRKVEILDSDTSETLGSKLSLIAAEMVSSEVVKWIKGEIFQREQDHSLATYCYQSDISKDKAEIVSDTTVESADRMVRAFYPWPVAWIKIDHGNHKDKRLKIFKALLTALSVGDENAKLLDVLRGKLVLNLSDGVLELSEVQLEGKDRRDARQYLWLLD